MAFETQSSITNDTETESKTIDTISDGGAEQTGSFTVPNAGGNSSNGTTNDLSENVVADVVEYSRGNIIGNEQQSVLTLLGWVTGWFDDPERFVNNVVIGTSASGKSHLVQNMKTLIPPDSVYSATSTSAKGLIDDDEWNDARVAIMSEWQKLPNEAREYMKSVAGDDGGFTYKRGKGGSDDGNNDGEAGADTIEKKPMPYSFTFAQFSMDHEMWTRLLKTYVDESKVVNAATARRHHGHENIELAGAYDEQYIRDVSHIRRNIAKHIAGMPTDAYTYMPEWVFYSVKPIYDLDRSESKRFTSSISNLIRSSCLLNYKQRETYTNSAGHDAYVVAPQDVANILACRETLLGTTHEIEPRKFKIIDAIDFATDIGADVICKLEDIQSYLESDQSDMSRLGRDPIRELLRELEEQFVVRIHERYEDSAHGYELLSLQKIGYAKLVGFEDIRYNSDDPFRGIDGDPNEPFVDVIDPIRDQPISETVTDMRQQLGRDSGSWSAAGAMGGSSTSASVSANASTNGDVDTSSASTDASVYKTEIATSTSTSTTASADGQQSLGASDDTDQYTIDDAIVATVYDHIEETVCDETVPVSSQHEHVIGIVGVDEEVSTTDVSGTLMDPDHDLWNQPDKPEGWVETQSQADAQLEQAYGELQDSGVLSYETTAQDESIPDEHVRVRLDTVEIDL